MPRLLSFLLMMCVPLGGASNLTRWKTNLEQSQGLQSFARETSALWMNQQGVLFLTPEQVLIYQVNRTQEKARLAGRDASGGAGNFVLNIKVLSVQDGHLIKSLNLPTNWEFSTVMATRSGAFLARTGDMLYLFSADFERLAAHELPLERAGPFENWQIAVAPSGSTVVLIHERVYATAERLADNSVLHDGRAKVDVEILNSDTLQHKNAFTLSHTLVFWSPGDDSLLSSNPAHSFTDGQVGTLDFNGNWSPLRAEFAMAKSPCPYSLSVIDQRRFVLYGCENFTVLSTEGKRLFAHKDGRYVFRSVVAGGSYFAVACDHYRLGDVSGEGWVITTQADRIEVYDLDRRVRLTSVSIHANRVYYSVSSLGDLAIVDGANMEMIHAGP